MVTADETGELRLWSMADLVSHPLYIDDCREEVVNIAFTNGERSFVTVTDASVTQRPARVSMHDR